MHIVIAGVGRVGSELARRTSLDGHDVVAIDKRIEALDRLGPEFNGETVIGDGAVIGGGTWIGPGNSQKPTVSELPLPPSKSCLSALNSKQWTCVCPIICTGMRLKKARRLCPELIQCPADPGRYAAASTAIMEALHGVTPDIEVFSVDEAFLDVTHCQRLLGTPLRMARLFLRRYSWKA